MLVIITVACSQELCFVHFKHCITRYGSTLYIGIAMVVPIPQYIRNASFYFQFQVNLTFSIFA